MAGVGKIILVDVDGILADLHSAFAEHMRLRHGRPLDPSKWTSWNVGDNYSEEIAQEFFRWLNTPLYQEDYMQPVEGSLEGVERLREIGEVFALSACYPGSMASKDQWLQDTFDFDHKHIILTDAKHIVYGDVLIEDRVKTCERWLDFWVPKGAAKNPRAILLDKPWNQPRPNHSALFRAYTWGQIVGTAAWVLKPAPNLVRT